MSDLLPEKIWYQHRTEPFNLPSYDAPPGGLDTVEYIRSDLADAQLESLQRENEALKASRDKLEGAYLSANERLAHAKKQAEGQCDGCGEQLDDAFCTKCLNKQAAITQEMRGEVIAVINFMFVNRPGLWKQTFPQNMVHAFNQGYNKLCEIRDLLGEQG